MEHLEPPRDPGRSAPRPVDRGAAAPLLGSQDPRTAPERRTAAVLFLLVLPLAFCEARALQRILIRDRMPGSQRFLRSLEDHRWEIGPALHAVPPLSHAERFILEAMDGYRVIEGRGDGPPAGADPGMPLLVRSSVAPPPVPVDDLDVLASARSFTLYGDRELAMEAARLTPPEGWRHYRRPLARGRARGGRRS
jgi:hypothetical protein